MKKAILIPLALLLIAVCVFLFVRYRPDIALRNPPNAEKAKQEALEYLENIKFEEGTIPDVVDEETGYWLIIYADSEGQAERVGKFLAKAETVRYVKSIPNLEYPVIHVGKDMVGNHKKIYYSSPKGIIEYTLSEAQSLGFLVYLSSVGKTYPEALKGLPEKIIQQLKSEMVYGDKDIVRHYDVSSPEDIFEVNIKTEKAAEMVFECIRNSNYMRDDTGANFAPSAPSSGFKIGKYTGGFGGLYFTYEETGQYICIGFTGEDSEALKEYCLSLAEQTLDN